MASMEDFATVIAGDVNNVRAAIPQVVVNESVGRRVHIGGELVASSTGPRDITSLISESHLPSTQVGRLTLLRTGTLVEISFQDLELAGTTQWVTIGWIPVGFRPPSDRPDTLFTNTGEAGEQIPTSLVIRANGAISMTKVAGRRHRTTLVYATTQNWPATLPGTPA